MVKCFNFSTQKCFFWKELLLLLLLLVRWIWVEHLKFEKCIKRWWRRRRNGFETCRKAISSLSPLNLQQDGSGRTSGSSGKLTCQMHKSFLFRISYLSFSSSYFLLYFSLCSTLFLQYFLHFLRFLFLYNFFFFWLSSSSSLLFASQFFKFFLPYIFSFFLFLILSLCI